jgi:pyruvate dehydrogenase E1 component beta subunit
MLKLALAEPDPVFIFEHAMLYPVEGEVDEAAPALPIGKAAVRRPGGDVTLITYGGSLPKCLAAADKLAEANVQAEVIDLRSLRPLDKDTILMSLSKTHRAVIVDEAWRTGSFAAEISATIMEEGFYNLDAPVGRICTAEVPLPYAKHLEDAALPQAEQIIQTVQSLL